MAIEKLFVVGAGTMGSGIAQAAATSGFRVVMMDVIPEQVERGMSAIARSVEKLAAKGTITAQQREAALNIQTAGDFSGLSEADLAIEAATENVELKLKIFRDLDRMAAPGAILASNTSSISITRIAAATQR